MNSSGLPFHLPSSREPAHEENRLPAQAPPPDVWIDWGPALRQEHAQDRCAAMVRDPWCVFTYWELTGAHAAWISEKHGAGVFTTGRWKCRLYRDGLLSTELDAAHPHGSAYLDAEPTRRWRTEVGLLMPDGTWISVASSAEVRTPRASIAPVIDDGWSITEEEMMEQLGYTREEARRKLEEMRREGRAGYGSRIPGPMPGSAGSSTSSRAE